MKRKTVILALLADIEDKIYEGVNDVVTDLAKEINVEFEKIVKITVQNALRIEQCIKKNISNGKQMISQAFNESADSLNGLSNGLQFSNLSSETGVKFKLDETHEMDEEAGHSVFLPKLEEGKLGLLDLAEKKASISRDPRSFPRPYRRVNKTCLECNKTFSTGQCFRKHRKSIHDMIKDFCCEHCDFSTSGKDNRHF